MDYALLIIAYLLGSIPFGLLIGKWFHRLDLRHHGSKNIGATNAFRVLGTKWGLLVFFLDVVKGFLAVIVCHAMSQTDSLPLSIGFGALAIVGHTFPIWLSFKGGKGVATSLGVFLAICPLQAVLTFGLWTLVFLLSRVISLASLIAAVSFPVIVYFTGREMSGFPWLLGISLFLSFLIFYTHRANLGRLLKGEEKKLF